VNVPDGLLNELVSQLAAELAPKVAAEGIVPARAAGANADKSRAAHPASASTRERPS
jgi:hypothetical protein